MPRMIAALFADRGRAQSALQAMIGTGVARDRIHVLSDRDEVSSISGFREVGARDDAEAELADLGLPPEDVAAFSDGLRRGGVLVAARVDQANWEEAIGVLEMFEPLDLDDRSAASAGEAGARIEADVGEPLAAGLSGGTGGGQTNTGALPGMDQLVNATHDIGSADLRTGEQSLSDMGGSAAATLRHRDGERAGRPGVLELAGGRAPYKRDTNRAGRVRAYVSV